MRRPKSAREGATRPPADQFRDLLIRTQTLRLGRQARVLICPASRRILGTAGAYIDDIISTRRRTLTDDLISELIGAQDDADRLTRDEMVRLVAILLNAGTDINRNQLAAAVHVLADHPEQWTMLAQQASEELVHHSPFNFRALRNAVVDVELGGRHSLRYVSHRQHGCSQPRPSRLRRPGPPRHLPQCGARHAGLLWRSALLSRQAPGPHRVNRGPTRPDHQGVESASQ